jgi:hypothetical protein
MLTATKATARSFFMASCVDCEAEAHGRATILMARARPIFQDELYTRDDLGAGTNVGFQLFNHASESVRIADRSLSAENAEFSGANEISR